MFLNPIIKGKINTPYYNILVAESRKHSYDPIYTGQYVEVNLSLGIMS